MSDYISTTLLLLPFVGTALVAAAVLGVLAGVLGPLIVTRNMAFSVHGTSELALTGGAAALLAGINVGYGSLIGAVVAAVILGLLTRKVSEHDSVIGAVLAFGLGVGVLLLSFYEGNSANKFGLLIGQIASVDSGSLVLLISAAVGVLIVLAFIYRPLLFASVDAEVAAARGVPLRILSPVFAVLVGVATALGVQTVGSLLVLSLMITPAAAASRVTASPVVATVLSIVFAELAVLGGIVLSLVPGKPVSAFVTAISFLIYLVCRLVGVLRARRIGSGRGMASAHLAAARP
ncbi:MULTISPECIES: metal ABC transporter permease [unclassified Kutzneria]|uniref:metal ABC transporter permease n=1 Tax=unclassified Kutzneria TaxID=2621979 RepID=UPI0004B2989F|nr:metal ABC transporter permease [Kutzneria sp. 744]